MGDDASKTTLDEITSFFVGLQWDEVGPGSLGIALGNTAVLLKVQMKKSCMKHITHIQLMME